MAHLRVDKNKSGAAPCPTGATAKAPIIGINGNTYTRTNRTEYKNDY